MRVWTGLQGNRERGVTVGISGMKIGPQWGLASHPILWLFRATSSHVCAMGEDAIPACEKEPTLPVFLHTFWGSILSSIGPALTSLDSGPVLSFSRP